MKGAIDHLRRAVREAEEASVHSVHTEIEGGRAFAGLFARQLEAWASDGVAFVTLTDVAGCRRHAPGAAAEVHDGPRAGGSGDDRRARA